MAYRLREDAGCHVTVDGEGQAVDAAVGYRMHTEVDGVLVWIGTGLEASGLTAGYPPDETGKDAARLLTNDCRPATGARLVLAELHAHLAAWLPGARLLEVLEAATAVRSLDDAAGLLAGKPN